MVDLSMPHRTSAPLGLVSTGKRKSTGTVTTLERTAEGVYSLRCQDHSAEVVRHGYGTALSAVAHPEQWCPGCRRMLGLPEAPSAEKVFAETLALCGGCAEHKAGVVVMRNLHVPHSMPMCPDCRQPGSAARARWDKRVAEGVAIARAEYTGPTRKQRDKRARKGSPRHLGMWRHEYVALDGAGDPIEDEGDG